MNRRFPLSLACLVTTVACGCADRSGGPDDAARRGTALAVVGVAPRDGAAGVGLDGDVEIVFSAALDCATLTDQSLIVSSPTGRVAGTIRCVDDVATFTPASAWDPANDYAVELTTAVRDAAGNALAAAIETRFSTVADLRSTVSRLERSLEAMHGDELYTPPWSGGHGGLRLSFQVLGFSFCEPPDPFAPPSASPSAGRSVYGCANGVDAGFEVAGRAVRVSLVASRLFVDFDGRLTVPGSFDAYLLGEDVDATVTYQLLERPDGRFRLGSVQSWGIHVAGWQIAAKPLYAGSLLRVFAPVLEPTIQDLVLELLVDVATDFGETAPEFVL